MKRHRAAEKKSCLVKAGLLGAHKKSLVHFQPRLPQFVSPVLLSPHFFLLFFCFVLFFPHQPLFSTRAALFLVVSLFLRNLKLRTTLICVSASKNLN